MGPAPIVSSAYLKGLLAARGKASSKSSKASAGVTKRKYRRRRKYKRRTAPRRTTAAATRAKTVKPKKKTAEIAIQTMDYGLDEDDDQIPMNVSVGSSNTISSLGTPKKKKASGELSKSADSKADVKRKMKSESADKKPAVFDIFTLDDDDDNSLVKKRYHGNDDNGPSTSRGPKTPTKSYHRLIIESSDDEAVEMPPVQTMTKVKKPSLNSTVPRVSTSVAPTVTKKAPRQKSQAVPVPVEDQMTAESAEVIRRFLFTPPIAVAIAKNLPMKSLNALAQVNPMLRDICRLEKAKKRRQCVDWFLRPHIITALDGDVIQNERRIFGVLLTDLYCEPDLIIAFCSPRIFYDCKVTFHSSRSPHQGHLRVLNDILSDLMPAHPSVTGSSKIVHVRTHGVMPPIPALSNTNIRKTDEYGCKESSKDLCVLVIPKIDGVNIWREFLTVSGLRKQLRDSGWLENRSQTHFLLPVIKELEPFSPKLVVIFARRMPNYTNVASSEFPVIVLNTLDDYVGAGLPNTRDGDRDYGVEWLAFGGSVTAFQICIKAASSSLERQLQISNLREQFSAQQVMSSRMLIFYFRNVTKFETENVTEQTALLERDIIQIREEFPRVPIFGGGYQNVIGSCFTKNKTDTEFGKFFSGLHSAFVCGVVLGAV